MKNAKTFYYIFLRYFWPKRIKPWILLLFLPFVLPYPCYFNICFNQKFSFHLLYDFEDPGMDESILEMTDFIDNFMWLNKTEFEEKIKRIDFSECSPCNMSNTTKSNSNPRDLVLCVLYGKEPHNILTFLRSLRSAKSQCTVVFLHSSEFIETMKSNYSRLLEETNKCGVIWLNFGTIVSYRYVVPITSRFGVIRLFLKIFGDMFDRVIIADTFDTFFQMDPFRQEFTTKLIRPTVENDNLAENSPNNEWIEAIDDEFDHIFYLDKIVLCAGLIYGGTKPTIRFLDKFVDLEFWFSLGESNLDQPILNLDYYRRKIFDTDFVPDINSTNMISATKWLFNEFPNSDDGLMHLISGKYGVPTAIHQYDRSCPMYRYAENVCPVLGEWQKFPYAKGKDVVQQCEGSRRVNIDFWYYGDDESDLVSFFDETEEEVEKAQKSRTSRMEKDELVSEYINLVKSTFPNIHFNETIIPK